MNNQFDNEIEKILSKFATHIYSPKAPIASKAFDEAITAIKELIKKYRPEEKLDKDANDDDDLSEFDGWNFALQQWSENMGIEK